MTVRQRPSCDEDHISSTATSIAPPDIAASAITTGRRSPGCLLRGGAGLASSSHGVHCHPVVMRGQLRFELARSVAAPVVMPSPNSSRQSRSRAGDRRSRDSPLRQKRLKQPTGDIGGCRMSGVVRFERRVASLAVITKLVLQPGARHRATAVERAIRCRQWRTADGQ